MFKHRRNMILMAAIGAALSVGGSATAAEATTAAPAFPDDGKIRLMHATTEQLCEFDTREQAENFGAGLDDDERANWRLVGTAPAPAAPGGRVVEVDLDQLRATLKDDIAKEDAAAAASSAPDASPVANETPAASPATGETAPAGE